MVELLLFPLAGSMVMVLSLEDCSHRKSVANTLQEKVPNKVHEIYMGMLCFAAFSISLITGLLYGIFRMQNTTFGHSFR